jgi:hypothetical protein
MAIRPSGCWLALWPGSPCLRLARDGPIEALLACQVQQDRQIYIPNVYHLKQKRAIMRMQIPLILDRSFYIIELESVCDSVYLQRTQAGGSAGSHPRGISKYRNAGQLLEVWKYKNGQLYLHRMNSCHASYVHRIHCASGQLDRPRLHPGPPWLGTHSVSFPSYHLQAETLWRRFVSKLSM